MVEPLTSVRVCKPAERRQVCLRRSMRACATRAPVADVLAALFVIVCVQASLLQGTVASTTHSNTYLYIFWTNVCRCYTHTTL